MLLTWCLDPWIADDGGVPATTGLGASLSVLLLLGGSAYFLRRGATS
jgi:hypothetical protein